MNQIHGEAAIRQIHIEIEGIVQGVGFRPFLHRLADGHRITGWVRNTSAGLEGVLQGTARDLEAFQAKLQDDAPPLAVFAVGQGYLQRVFRRADKLDME